MVCEGEASLGCSEGTVVWALGLRRGPFLGLPGWLARASRPRWPVALQVGVLEALMGTLGEEDRLFARAPRVLRVHIRTPGASAPGRRMQGRGPTLGPQAGCAGLGSAALPLPVSLLPSSRQKWPLARQQTAQGRASGPPSLPSLSCWASLVFLWRIGADAAADGCRSSSAPWQAGCTRGVRSPRGRCCGVGWGPACGNTTAWGSSATLGPLPAGCREGPACCRAWSAVRQGCPAPCGDAQGGLCWPLWGGGGGNRVA